jgi:HTH-type transcriptional regulator, sugar sensing transcriptional regulator
MTKETALTESAEALRELGFTALEAEVYSALVELSVATAYRVAQEVGKAAANVYKAVESLLRKGAIVVDDSASRLYRAVPPAELLRQMEKRFANARTRAERALGRLQRSEGDERIYQLTSREQVLERARGMISSARVSVLCDLFPDTVAELEADLSAASKRGVRVFVHVYRPIALAPGIQVFTSAGGERLLERWPGQWVNVVVDAQKHLLALLDARARGVLQAVYSESTYLSVTYFSALSVEMMFGRTIELLEGKTNPARIRTECARMRRAFEEAVAPGYTALLQRFGQNVPSASTVEARRGAAPGGTLPRRRTRRPSL